MEVFGARTAEPIQTCVEEVKKSKIFIGILGMRYGSIDPESGKSFVQIEYDTAINHGLDVLIYLIDEENALISPVFVDKDENAKKLQEFKDYLRKNHTVEFFLSPDDLVKKIERDLLRLAADKGLIIDEGKFEPVSDEKPTIELINKFNVLPKLLNGTEIELVVEFVSPPYPIQKQTCDALNLTYGSSVERRIKINRPKDIPQKQLQFLQELFADGGLAEFVYDAEPEREYNIIAKLSFGMEQHVIKTSTKSFGLHSRTPPIVDLDTKEKIENYIQYNPIKALVFVTIII